MWCAGHLFSSLLLCLSVCMFSLSCAGRAVTTGSGHSDLSSVSTADLDSSAVPSEVRETKFGVALAAPKYNPFGVFGPNLVFRGASDMHMLGFSTIKLWLNLEVVNQETTLLPEDVRGSVRGPVDILRLPSYQQILDLPVDTLVFFPDSFSNGSHTWSIKREVPFSEAERREIYDVMYETASYLLSRLKGTGKTVILQNHEGDWHLVERVKQDRPTEIQLKNMEVYLSERQRAVNDARNDVTAENVFLYHMCEVVDVVRAMESEFPTITNRILPNLTCDLVGYSAYDSSLVSADLFNGALQYLKEHARPSRAFGANNVIVSEIGYPERKEPTKHRGVLDSIAHAVNLKVPYVLLWTSYDNECQRSSGEINSLISVTDGQCHGFWVRKPNAALSQMYRDLIPHLGHSLEEYLKRASWFYLDREPGRDELQAWKVDRSPSDIPAIDHEFRNSPEARAAFVRRMHRDALEREPGDDELQHGLTILDENGGSFRKLANLFVSGVSNSTEEETIGTSAWDCNGVEAIQFAAPTSLSSCDGRFSLVFQDDGNLVLYRKSDGSALWSSLTGKNLGGSAAIFREGELAVVDSAGQKLFSSGPIRQRGAKLVLQNDGNLLIYAGGRAVWNSNSGAAGFEVPELDIASETVNNGSVGSSQAVGTAPRNLVSSAPSHSPQDHSGDAFELFVQQWYRAYLGREPERQGMTFWVSKLRSGSSCSDLALDFLRGLNFASERKDLSHEDFLDRLYSGFLGRSPDEPGKKYWLDQLSHQRVTREDVARDVVQSLEYRARCPRR